MKAILRTIIAGLVIAASPSFSADSSPESPRLLVHLLDYLAKDYGGAVRDGQVINAMEYREQEEFAGEALALAHRLPELKTDTDMARGVSRLNDLVQHKAPPEEVAALALRLKAKVISIGHVSQVPDRWPSLERGRTLFLQNCVACHGERGAGDGPAAATLNPQPTNFVSEEVGADMSPFRAFNTIRVGIPGTAMVAWPTLSDEEAWSLAFYVTSLHIDDKAQRQDATAKDLALAATRTDRELLAVFQGDEASRRARVAGLRLHSPKLLSESPAATSSLPLARQYLKQASEAFAAKDFETARRAALLAYLEGIEPVEPQLRARDNTFVGELEANMAAVRSGVERQAPESEFKTLIDAAAKSIDAAESRLASSSGGPWVTFLLTVGILLREGFEAVLILIALLAVIRASDTPGASRWVHAGWASALAVGIAAWFFSGWVMAISGAQREMLEGVTSLIAVAVLLYVGFWLHSRTEISRWTQFISVQVKSMLSGGRLWGLAAIAFMAVFREAFETVLFMRALTLEGGASSTHSMVAGAAISIVGLIALSWLLLKFSARLPIRQIFTVSSALMVILAVILTGKGIHALQETGAVSVSETPWRWSTDLFGVYANWQALIAQLTTALVVVAVWRLGSRSPAVMR